ncbi:hypothetical protein WJX81_002446 [Elliptochloris bilobata]|uniref:Cytochrome c oxidase subunit Vb n=1 Tax=Elliptochloris bilobata TaxID=381761 RepID=A0AAW1RS23_9CHLO
MNRLAGALRLAARALARQQRAPLGSIGTDAAQNGLAFQAAELQKALPCGFAYRGVHTSTAAAATDVLSPGDIEHATGLEREELEGKAKGIDIFHEDWLDAPWGTEDKPVEVTSSFSERIVGVPDPYDDSIVWWGTIEEGQPPKQLVEGGEFFVLKRIPDSGNSGHH